jgi:hypothetical protein
MYYVYRRDIYKVRIRIGKLRELRVVNIYNPIGYIDTIIKLKEVFGRKIGSSTVILRDFNLYYLA